MHQGNSNLFATFLNIYIYTWRIVVAACANFIHYFATKFVTSAVFCDSGVFVVYLSTLVNVQVTKVHCNI